MALWYTEAGSGDSVGTQSAKLNFHISDDGAGAPALIIGGITLHPGYSSGTSPPLGYVWKWWRFNSPATFEELKKVDVSVDMVDQDTYNASVDYGPYDYLGKEETQTSGGASSEWTFEVKVATAKQVQSIQTMNRYAPPGKTAADHKGAMNVTKQGVQGLDVPKPQASFTQTYYVDPSAFTSAYKADLERAVGRMNSVTFASKEPGECMLVGITATGRGRENVQMQAQFDVSPNAEDLEVGEITGIVKRGFDALWVEYEESVDESADPPQTVKTPIAVHVEQVCEELDFAGELGL